MPSVHTLFGSVKSVNAFSNDLVDRAAARFLPFWEQFTYMDKFPIRAVEIDGKPWLVAADAARVLGFTTNAGSGWYTRHLGSDERISIHLSDGKRGNPNKTVVSESGLYKLVMRSDKPDAKPFQDWITRTVLPAVRKDGSYIQDEEKLATGEMDEDEFVLKAIEILKRKVERLKTENEAMSQELNVVTVDEWRALNHLFMSHGRKTKLGLLTEDCVCYLPQAQAVRSLNALHRTLSGTKTEAREGRGAPERS